MKQKEDDAIDCKESNINTYGDTKANGINNFKIQGFIY